MTQDFYLSSNNKPIIVRLSSYENPVFLVIDMIQFHESLLLFFLSPTL